MLLSLERVQERVRLPRRVGRPRPVDVELDVQVRETPRLDRGAFVVDVDDRWTTGPGERLISSTPQRKVAPFGFHLTVGHHLPFGYHMARSAQVRIDRRRDALSPHSVMVVVVVVDDDDHPDADLGVGADQGRAVDPSVAALLVPTRLPSYLGRHATTLGQSLGQLVSDAGAAANLR